jgi:hypothetical protein
MDFPSGFFVCTRVLVSNFTRFLTRFFSNHAPEGLELYWREDEDGRD